GVIQIVGGPETIAEQSVVAVRIPKAANAQAPVVPVGTAKAEAERIKSEPAVAETRVVTEAVVQVVVDVVELRVVQVIEAVVNIRAVDVRNIQRGMRPDPISPVVDRQKIV